MEFDYTTLPERAGYDAIAVDALGKPGAPGAPKGGFDAIPMWVADMDFSAPPADAHFFPLRFEERSVE